jgi:quercetin dioxygenase-like cupin family protein
MAGLPEAVFTPQGGPMLSSVILVKRKEIPAIFEIEDAGKRYPLGEHRDFRRHPLLEKHIPESGEFGISWAYLKPGQVLPVHVHPIVSMVVIVGGSGNLLGDRQELLEEGDTVLIGAGCHHGFAGSDPNGLRVLTIQFEQKGMYRDVNRPLVNFVRQESTLDALLDYNNARLLRVESSDWFKMSSDGTLNDLQCRKRFLACLQTFSRHFQAIMFARQATCADDSFRVAFLRHLQAEIGHDELLGDGQEVPDALWDPVIEAVSSWFVSRMHVLDNCEKAAVVHLVLETIGEKFHVVLSKTMQEFSSSPYFKEHAVADGEHVELGLDLLRNLHPRVYARLREVVGQAWDMFEILADRMLQLVREADAPLPAVSATRSSVEIRG